MDGWVFREKQLADPRVRDVPLIVLTAATGSVLRHPALRETVVLQKPIGGGDLARALDTARSAT
jgi:hypothetical protein